MRKREAYLEHLGNVPMFSACPKRELQLLARAAEEIRIEPGTEIIHEGDRGHEFFVIAEGKAQVTRNGVEVATLGPGAFFGELALLDRTTRDATVTALTPMEVILLGQREFSAVLAEAPSMTHKLMVGMARRLHELDSKA